MADIRRNGLGDLQEGDLVEVFFPGFVKEGDDHVFGIEEAVWERAVAQNPHEIREVTCPEYAGEYSGYRLVDYRRISHCDYIWPAFGLTKLSDVIVTPVDDLL